MSEIMSEINDKLTKILDVLERIEGENIGPTNEFFQAIQNDGETFETEVEVNGVLGRSLWVVPAGGNYSLNQSKHGVEVTITNAEGYTVCEIRGNWAKVRSFPQGQLDRIKKEIGVVVDYRGQQ